MLRDTSGLRTESDFMKLHELNFLPLTLKLLFSVCCFMGVIFKTVSFRIYTLGRKGPHLISLSDYELLKLKLEGWFYTTIMFLP